MPLRLITREEWGARPPRWAAPELQHPLKYITFSYVINEKSMKVDVAAVMHYLQKRDIVSGQADIQTNFVIGEDGGVFEGRGWFTQPGDQGRYPDKAFLEITYLGDFSDEPLTHPVFRSTKHLLETGIKKGYILKNAEFLDLDNGKLEASITQLLASVKSQTTHPPLST